MFNLLVNFRSIIVNIFNSGMIFGLACSECKIGEIKLIKVGFFPGNPYCITIRVVVLIKMKLKWFEACVLF